MITTTAYLVFCLVAVSLFTIVAIGECRSESEGADANGGSDDSEDADSDGGKIVVRSHLRSRR